MTSFGRVEEYVTGRYEVLAGHLGLLPDADRTVTLLREPAARAWSHYHAIPWPGEALPFAEFLEHPVYGWCGRDYQAHWLGIPPQPGEARWKPAVAAGLPAPAGVVAAVHGSGAVAAGGDPFGAPLGAAARATLDGCALAGTTERVDDFAVALGRLLGRRLAPLPRINVRADGSGPPEREAELVRRRSPLDRALHARAGRALDAALRDLPELPAEPPRALPYRHTMDAPLCGTGWHARVFTPEAGWHRWTGPGLRSTLHLPVRLDGPARLRVAIVSACDDAAVASLRMRVQGRPVQHALEPRRMGVTAAADVELRGGAPLEIELEVAHVRPMPVDPAALAVADIELDRR